MKTTTKTTKIAAPSLWILALSNLVASFPTSHAQEAAVPSFTQIVSGEITLDCDDEACAAVRAVGPRLPNATFTRWAGTAAPAQTATCPRRIFSSPSGRESPA
jgi:hypothetical protein